MRFSIIVPVYNVAPYLRECLDSIVAAVARFSKPVELICIDDGSTDSSGKMLDCYVPKSALVAYKILHQDNAGVSVARNKGLESATGEYICFVDADDTVDEQWLIAYDAILSDVDADLVRMGKSKSVKTSYLMYQADALKAWGWRELAQNGYNWRYVVKRVVAIKARFPVGVTYCEDSLYTMQLLPYLKRAIQMDGSYYNYRVRLDSAMRQKYSSYERLLFLQAITDICKTQPDFDKDVISRSVLGNVLAWANKPRDVEYASKIYAVVSELTANNIVNLRFVPSISQVPCMIYCATGWLWPVKGYFALINICVRIKHLFKIWR